MAKYKPQIGDEINFNHQAATRSKVAKSSLNTGTITWMSSNGKFLTLFPHTVIINNAYGKPMLDCSVTIDTTDIIGLTKT